MIPQGEEFQGCLSLTWIRVLDLYLVTGKSRDPLPAPGYLIDRQAKVTVAPPSPPQKFARASPASIVDLKVFDQGSAEISDRGLPKPPLPRDCADFHG